MSTTTPEGDWVTLPCGHQVPRNERHDEGIVQSHYCGYLAWGIMRPLAERAYAGSPMERPFHNDDEAMFVVVHQISELGFTRLLAELESARAQIDGNAYAKATKHVHRAIKWLRHAVDTAKLLFSMDTGGFMEPKVGFRDLVVPASGAESSAVREIELLFGMRADSPYMLVHGRLLTFRQVMDVPPGIHGRGSRWWTHEMARRASERSVVDAFRDIITRDATTLRAILDRGAKDPLRLLMAALWNFEKEMLEFRKVHYYLAAHHFMIAAEMGYIPVKAEDLKGTGVGVAVSSTAEEMPAALGYLEAAFRTARLFPELFDLMSLVDPTIDKLLKLNTPKKE